MPRALSLDEAQQVVDAVLAECRRRGVAAGVAVVDERGDLFFAARMDGASFYDPDVAYGKAIASALWEAPSKGLAATSAGNSVQQRANSLNGGRLVFAPGAVPLLREGAVVGAVGVSGPGADLEDELAALGAGALPA